MPDSNLVSVLLPVFNGAAYLPQALESVLKQSWKNFELLVADDGSVDDSWQIIQKYAACDSRIVAWQNPARLGLFGNYNETIRRARGEFLKPFAQDDLLEPQCLEILMNALLSHQNVSLVSAARKIVDQHDKELEVIRIYSSPMVIPAQEVIAFQLIMLTNWIGEPSTVMFRQQYAGVGFDTNYYHFGDIEYWFRILEQGDYISLPDVVCSFRRHDTNETVRNHKQMYSLLDMLRLSLSYRAYLQDIETEEHFYLRLSELASLQLGHILSESAEMEKNMFSEFLQTQRDPLNQFGTFEVCGFRSLALAVLRGLASKAVELDYEKRCREIENERFRKEVLKMQNSIYWRLTNPLRRLKALIRSGSLENKTDG